MNNLREIQALRRLSPHEHIISLEEVLYDQPTGRLALVFELMDANLYELIRGRRHYLNPQLIKSYMWQLMKSLDHMHKKGIFHRDIKPENILIESSTDIGRGLKLADFGSCRGIYSKQPYTEYISTRWYRAPECLLTDGYYGPEMDLWGAGCVMFEITSLFPLFPGSNEMDQITRIHKVLGTPSQELLAKFKARGASHISFDFPMFKGVGFPQLIPHASADAVDLLVKLLKYDASERITAREAMRHPYFRDVREAEMKKVAAQGSEVDAKSGAVKQQVQQGQPQMQQQQQQQQQGAANKVVAGGVGAAGGGGVVSGNKALPSISGQQGSSVNLDNSQQKTYPSASELYQQHQPVVLKPSQTLKTLLPTGGVSSSLPPIGGGILSSQVQKQQQQQQMLMQQQQQQQQMDPKQSARSQQSQQPSNQQKRRKKYRFVHYYTHTPCTFFLNPLSTPSLLLI